MFPSWIRAWVWPSWGSSDQIRRTRQARLTSGSAALSQGITLLTGLLAIPITIRYLGPERYGVWLTLHSLLVWASVMDLGLGGNALVNALSDAYGRMDRAWARQLVSTALAIVTALVIAMSLGLALAFEHISWSRVFNVSPHFDGRELHSAVIVAWIGFALTLPMGVAVGAAYGLQVGYIANLWNALATLLGLCGIWAVTKTGWGLPGLFAVAWGARLACGLGCVLHLVGAMAAWLRPQCRPSLAAIRRLSSLGLRYLVGQIAGVCLFFSQPMILSQSLSPEKAGLFGVSQRLVTSPLTLLQMLINPLMPAYGEARARGDWSWIAATLRGSMLVAGVGALALVLPLAIATPWIMERWAGPSVVPGRGLVSALAAYVVINGMLIPISVMLFGIERVTGQVTIAASNAIVTVIASLWLVPKLGSAGMAVAMALGMLVINAVGQGIELRRAWRDAAAAVQRAP